MSQEDFEGWVRSHKHSSRTIESLLDSALWNIEANETDHVEGLRWYVDDLKNLEHEIKGEIAEVREWIERFSKQGV